MPESLYERDFYAWTREQADLLRAEARRGNNAPVDWEHVAEELDTMGRSEWNELENRLTVLLVHLLKLFHVEELRERNGRQWWLTVREQRRMIPKRLDQSPSLRPSLISEYASIYSEARVIAAEEADVDPDRFPLDPAYSLDQALQADFGAELVPRRQH